MIVSNFWSRTPRTLLQTNLIGILVSILWLAAEVTGQTAASARPFAPEDLFRLRRVGVTAWAPNGLFATIEFSKDSRWLDSVPTNDLSLLDVKTRSLRVLSPKSSGLIGFFNAVWSPDSRRVAFLSVDREATVRVWVWTVGTQAPSMLPNLDARSGQSDTPIAWIDSERLAVMAWERDAVRSGPLYARVLRGRNVVTNWKRATEGNVASVSVVESRSTPASTKTSPEPAVELLTIDLRSGLRKTLARGRLNRLGVTPGGCCISFVSHDPNQPAASYFDIATSAGDVDAGYVAVNWGTERHLIDARTGSPISRPAETIASKPQPRPSPPPPPRSDARLLSQAPTGDAALHLAQGQNGSRLWLSGGAGRALTESLEIWSANEWMSEIKLGRAESFSYAAQDGTRLTGWLLLPANHVAGTRVPIVTVVYPGSV
jgi:dipeptidyl aminopeptidase/acylaminoacyl peptidase